jgi:hypothetical protein
VATLVVKAFVEGLKLFLELPCFELITVFVEIAE